MTPMQKLIGLGLAILLALGIGLAAHGRCWTGAWA